MIPPTVFHPCYVANCSNRAQARDIGRTVGWYCDECWATSVHNTRAAPVATPPPLDVAAIEFHYNHDTSLDIVYVLRTGARTRRIRAAEEFRAGDTCVLRHGSMLVDGHSIREALL